MSLWIRVRATGQLIEVDLARNYHVCTSALRIQKKIQAGKPDSGSLNIEVHGSEPDIICCGDSLHLSALISRWDELIFLA